MTGGPGVSQVMPAEIFESGCPEGLLPNLGINGFDRFTVIREHEPRVHSELPLDHLTGDPVERNTDAFTALGLVGMNPSDVALHIHLTPFKSLHIGLP